MTKRLTVLVLAATLLVPVWSQGSGAQTSGDAAASPALDDAARAQAPMTHQRLRRVVVPRLCNLRSARLVNGRHPYSRVYPVEGPDAWIVGLGRFDEGRPATRTGDLNRNGIKDGFIVMRCRFHTHSSYEFDHVFAYRANGTFMGRVPVSRNIPPSWAQFSVILNRTYINNNRILITVRHYRDSDAHCCPSRITSLKFTYVNGAFRRVR